MNKQTNKQEDRQAGQTDKLRKYMQFTSFLPEYIQVIVNVVPAFLAVSVVVFSCCRFTAVIAADGKDDGERDNLDIATFLFLLRHTTLASYLTIKTLHGKSNKQSL